MSNNLWPSQQVSTSRSTKSTVKPMKVRMDWASANIMLVFVLLLVGGLAFGAYQFLVLPAVDHVQSVFDNMQLVSSRR